jgi:hypothetical protein
MCLRLFKTAFFFLLSLLFSVCAFSQIDSTSASDKITSNLFLKDANNYINIKLDVDSDFERFDLVGDNFEYDIRPNIALKSKLSFSYKFISFGISYFPKFIPGNNDDDLKGKTKGIGFGLNLNMKHWIQDLKYSNVEGFYLENSSDFDPNFIANSTPYILFPDLKITSFQGSTSYKFNPNFSLKAISTQTEIQLKSAGSFIPGIHYSFYTIDNKSDSKTQQTSQRSNSFEVLLHAGYFHTFVLNKSWYAAFGLTPGFGINYSNLLTRLPEENERTNFSNAVFRINGRSGIGYNSERFFGGAEINAYRSFRNDNNSTINIVTTSLSYQIFIGYRFKAPKFLKKTVDEIQHKIPL